MSCQAARASGPAALFSEGWIVNGFKRLASLLHTICSSDISRTRFLQQGLETGQPVLWRDLFLFLGHGVANIEAHFVDEAGHITSDKFTRALASFAPSHMQ